MKALKTSIWILVGIAIVAGLAMMVRKRTNEKNNAKLIKPIPVSVNAAAVVNGKVNKSIHVLGTVIGMDEAMVAPRIMARILEIRVREGNKVKKNEVLAVLDAREIEDAVSQTRAGLEAARAGAAAAHTGFLAVRDATARAKKLFRAKAISKEQWDRAGAANAAAQARFEAAKAAVIVAKKRVDQAFTRLGYAKLKAPFDGLVAARLKDPGDLAVPGRPVLKLVRGHAIRVRAQVPANDFTALKVGLGVRISTSAQSVEAKISRVFPAMGRNHLAAFEADLASPPTGFVSGTPVGVDIDISGATGMKVPVDALLDGEKGSFVFVVKNSVTHPVKVTVLGRSLDNAVIGSKELHIGDMVITARPSRLMTLYKGELVELVNADTLPGNTKVKQ